MNPRIGKFSRRYGWLILLIGLIPVLLFIAAIFRYPSHTEELTAIGTVALTYALVYLYYQQKSIIATEYKPDIILEGVKEVDSDPLGGKLLALSLSNIGEGQATDLEARVESEINSQRIPKVDEVRHLNRHDVELEGWFQKPGTADYLDAGERKQLFVIDLTTELIFGNRLGASIGWLVDQKPISGSLEADRLSLKMEIRYQDTLGREYSDLAFDYIGPFEEGLTLSEFFQRGYQRETYELLKQSMEDWYEPPTDSGEFDPIDIADGEPLKSLMEETRKEEENQ